MTIGELINSYGKEDSPYMRGLVNHLPMGQLALYKMTKDLDKVKNYSENFEKRSKIDPIKTNYPKVNSIEECVGNRELYESCLDLITEKTKEKYIEELLEHTLNKYILGMSSGLFHTLIRVAYGVEGMEIDKDLINELERALAYYITAYREADIFTREIDAANIQEEMEELIGDSHIKDILQSSDTLGQKMRGLYDDSRYMERGFIIRGNEEEKIKGLLDLLIPAYNNSGSIVVLHCITGLHALIVLKEYYNDFNKAIDVLTTCIITHLVTIENLIYEDKNQDKSELPWICITSQGADASDVHAIKLTYSGKELDDLYTIPGLKDAALKRIKGSK